MLLSFKIPFVNSSPKLDTTDMSIEYVEYINPLAPNRPSSDSWIFLYEQMNILS